VLIGPIFSRELVTAPRRGQHFLHRGVYGAALFVLMCTAWMVLAGTQVVHSVGDMARFGSVLFLILAPLQLALMTFLAALRAASSVALEKDKRTLVLLLMTRLTNHELVLGKLLASLLDVLVMLATATPIFFFLTLFGGVSVPQVVRALAVTFATVLVAGSLGSTVAFAREKTFQSLAMTALILVIWLIVLEAVVLLAGHLELWGVRLETVAAAASPVRAILAAAHPARDVLGWFHAADAWYLVVALALALLLNAWAIVRLRVWNPGRDVFPQTEDASESESMTRDSRASEGTPSVAGGMPSASTAIDPELARSTHVDARQARPQTPSRQVWDNPVLWREVCTWAYGRKVLVIKAVYWLVFLLAAAGVYWTVHTGAAYLRASETIVPAPARPLAPFFLVSLVIINALAVTSITNERDGGSLDLLLVTDLTPRELLLGKMLGVAYVTWEMLAGPLLLAVALYGVGAMSLENLVYLVLGLAVMDLFVITLGIHSGMSYANSRTAIAVSLGSVFFLFLGVVTLILFMISFSGSYQVQLGPFLAFIVGGSVGLFVALGSRNASTAIGWASLLLPFATFFAVTNFLVDHWAASFFVTSATYGFTTAAMLVPAFAEFDVARARTPVAEEE
jgi:ABC-type transport system involved in multi-copper enzyme maturation permease subunit